MLKVASQLLFVQFDGGPIAEIAIDMTHGRSLLMAGIWILRVYQKTEAGAKPRQGSGLEVLISWLIAKIVWRIRSQGQQNWDATATPPI